MGKSLAEMPIVGFTNEDIMSGAFPVLQARAAQEHGPIYKWVIESGFDAGEYVYMVGPEANRFVLHTHRTHFSHEQGWTPILGDFLGRGLLNMDDPEHARHRKMWNPAFTSAFMEAYLPLIQRVIIERTLGWPRLHIVDVYREAREITFDIAAAALAGFETGTEVDRLRELFHTLLHANAGESWQLYMARALVARSELVDMLLSRIETRRRSSANIQPRDVLGMIVNARDEQGQELSSEQVLGHLNILLVAGHETTTMLSAWILYLLATLPEQRRRIEAELDALPGASVGSIPVEAVRTMKSLDNFIREAGRLYSPIRNVPRGVLQDFEFGGYHVPVGTPVRLALAASHHLPHIFANPETFDPDRFAPPREEDKQYPYSLGTFGGGPRICIGLNFANIEIKALVAHVLHTYRLAPVSDQPPTQAGHWNAIVPDGIQIQVEPRPDISISS